MGDGVWLLRSKKLMGAESGIASFSSTASSTVPFWPLLLETEEFSTSKADLEKYDMFHNHDMLKYFNFQFSDSP